MAFVSNDLSVLAYANGFTLWHYTSIDDSTAVTGANYFDPASDMLRVGDLVIANLDTDGSAALALYRIAGNTGGAVTVGAV